MRLRCWTSHTHALPNHIKLGSSRLLLLFVHFLWPLSVDLCCWLVLVIPWKVVSCSAAPPPCRNLHFIYYQIMNNSYNINKSAVRSEYMKDSTKRNENNSKFICELNNKTTRQSFNQYIVGFLVHLVFWCGARLNVNVNKLKCIQLHEDVGILNTDVE